MATIQTTWATGQDTPPRPQTAGAAHVARYVYDFTGKPTLVNADILEMGPIPPFARISEVTLIPEGSFAGVTCSIGVMTGEAGDAVTARTVGAEFFAASTGLTAMARSTVVAGHVLEPSTSARGIGIDFSADVVAGAKKVTLLVTFFEG
jgi:hypothetical protein